MAGSEHDFLMEKQLRRLDADLHRRFTDAVFALQHTLSHYRRLFPEYTDHSELHSLSVIRFPRPSICLPLCRYPGATAAPICST